MVAKGNRTMGMYVIAMEEVRPLKIDTELKKS
jgi:hypothetical protein